MNIICSQMFTVEFFAVAKKLKVTYIHINNLWLKNYGMFMQGASMHLLQKAKHGIDTHLGLITK